MGERLLAGECEVNASWQSIAGVKWTVFQPDVFQMDVFYECFREVCAECRMQNSSNSSACAWCVVRGVDSSLRGFRLLIRIMSCALPCSVLFCSVLFCSVLFCSVLLCLSVL